jgi:hypothetical protein
MVNFPKLLFETIIRIFLPVDDFCGTVDGHFTDFQTNW